MLSVTERIAKMNREAKETKEKARLKREKEKPTNILTKLFNENKLKEFKERLCTYDKDKILAEFVCISTAGDSSVSSNMDIIKLLLKCGAKPTHYYCKESYLMREKKYKILTLLAQNGLLCNATFMFEQACYQNLSHDVIEQLLHETNCTLNSNHRIEGSPLYFAVANRNIPMIKWLLNTKNIDIHSSPSCHSEYPPIAGCIEMLKERYRDWFYDANPIDTTPHLNRMMSLFADLDEDNTEKQQNITNPIHWDLRQDKEWIALCNILQLLVSYGANPFLNYSIRRTYGNQSSSPSSILDHNVCKFNKENNLELVALSLVNGFRERIKRKATEMEKLLVVDRNICEIIASFVIGAYYAQLKCKQYDSFKNDPIPGKTHRYNKAGDEFPYRTNGFQITYDRPKRPPHLESLP